MFNLFSPEDHNTFFTNNVDPDEMANNEPSHLDLICLTFCSWFTYANLFCNNGCVQMQRWKSLFQKLRVERVKVYGYGWRSFCRFSEGDEKHLGVQVISTPVRSQGTRNLAEGRIQLMIIQYFIAQSLYSISFQKAYTALDCTKPVQHFITQSLYSTSLNKTHTALHCTKPIQHFIEQNLYSTSLHKAYTALHCTM